MLYFNYCCMRLTRNISESSRQKLLLGCVLNIFLLFAEILLQQLVGPITIFDQAISIKEYYVANKKNKLLFNDIM